MTSVRKFLGWTSWMIVAAWLYGVIWTHMDDSLGFALPANFYLWVGDAFGVYSHDDFHYMFIWTTSFIAVFGIHAIAWIAVKRLKLASGPGGLVLRRWRGRVFSMVGWISWLLVATLATLVVRDAIHEAAVGKPAGDSGTYAFEFIVGFLVIGMIQLMVFQILRSRRR